MTDEQSNEFAEYLAMEMNRESLIQFANDSITVWCENSTYTKEAMRECIRGLEKELAEIREDMRNLGKSWEEEE